MLQSTRYLAVRTDRAWREFCGRLVPQGDPCFVPRSAISLILSVAPICLTLSPAAARSGDATDAEVADSLRQWRDSFVNIRVRFVSNLHYDEGGQNPFSSSSIHSEWVWTEERQFHEESTVYWDEHVHSRELAGTNGKVFFLAEFGGPDDVASNIPNVLTLYDAKGAEPGRQGAVVVPLDGLWIPQGCRWLGNEVGALSIASGEEMHVDGVPCRRALYPLADGLKRVLALDPTHGFLPKEVTFMNQSDSGGRYRFVVHEFRRVEPGIWFPWRGELWGAIHRQEWEVEEVELNASFLPSYFDPPPSGAGTRVFDGVQRRSYVVDGASPHIAPRRPDDGSRRVGIAATPGHVGAWAWMAVLVVLGLVFLLAARKLTRNQ